LSNKLYFRKMLSSQILVPNAYPRRMRTIPSLFLHRETSHVLLFLTKKCCFKTSNNCNKFLRDLLYCSVNRYHHDNAQIFLVSAHMNKLLLNKRNLLYQRELIFNFSFKRALFQLLMGAETTLSSHAVLNGLPFNLPETRYLKSKPIFLRGAFTKNT